MLNNVTVFDFETTGLDGEKDQVIEMAAICCVDGKIVSTFSTIVYCETKISPKITEITGITQDDVDNGMNARAAFWTLKRLMGNSLLVAHNAGFDLTFLHRAFLNFSEGTTSVENDFVDTLTISRDRFTYPHKLQDMCDRCGIVLEGAHRALNDVIACWELLKVLHADKPVNEYKNVLGYNKKYGPPKWHPSYSTLKPQVNRYDN